MSLSRQRSTSLEDHRWRDTTHRRDRRDRDGDSRRDRDRHGRDHDEDSDRRRRHRKSRDDRVPEEEDRDSDSSRRRERRHERRSRSRDDSRRRRRRRRRSRSPDPKRPRRSHSRSHSPPRRSRAPLPSQTESYRGTTQPPSHTDAAAAAPPKQKPNFRPTGLLAKEANTIAGTTTVLKYHEPPEARQPPAKDAWRLYVFKTRDLLSTIPLPDRSCWLFGRDRTVADVPLDHPSVSKQHAVLQFRHLTTTDPYGETRGRVKPYLIDLESANGTRLNGDAVDPRRYVELRDGDVVAFGESEREYVLMLPKP